jgi:dephospho-CoA kinase
MNAARGRKIALTGGIATGKSTVAKLFAELGAVILDADVAAREVVCPGTPTYATLRSFLGPDHFDSDGTLNRAFLRRRIVREPELRERINAIMHPAIIESLDRAREAHLREEPSRPVLFDIPLLFEIGMAERFDVVILAYSTPEVQLRRLMERDGLSRSEAEKTRAMQPPIDSKRAACHVVIDNSFDLATTRRQVEAVWKDLFRP